MWKNRNWKERENVLSLVSETSVYLNCLHFLHSNSVNCELNFNADGLRIAYTNVKKPRAKPTHDTDRAPRTFISHQRAERALALTKNRTNKTKTNIYSHCMKNEVIKLFTLHDLGWANAEHKRLLQTHRQWFSQKLRKRDSFERHGIKTRSHIYSWRPKQSAKSTLEHWNAIGEVRRARCDPANSIKISDIYIIHTYHRQTTP